MRKRDVRSGSNGDTDVRACERGSVIDAVCRHCNDPTAASGRWLLAANADSDVELELHVQGLRFGVCLIRHDSFETTDEPRLDRVYVQRDCAGPRRAAGGPIMAPIRLTEVEPQDVHWIPCVVSWFRYESLEVEDSTAELGLKPLKACQALRRCLLVV
jgi:hypothetical protein